MFATAVAIYAKQGGLYQIISQVFLHAIVSIKYIQTNEYGFNTDLLITISNILINVSFSFTDWYLNWYI